MGIDGLNSNSGAIIAIATAIQVIITGVLVGITYYYAQVTKKILEENRQMRIDAEKMRVDAQKPDIVIYLESERSSKATPIGNIAGVSLYVNNIGVGCAYDVEFKTDRSLRTDYNLTLGDILFLSHGIDTFPPGHTRMRGLSDSLSQEFKGLREKQLNITVNYKDSMQKKYTKDFPLDFREHIRG